MKFDVLTLFPELIQSHLDFSIMKRAVDDGIISVNAVNPRDFTLDKHKKVDDTPYGGGAGMVLMPQPYVDAYNSVEKLENSITLMMTPQGEPFSDAISNELAQYEQIIILCGHYEGYDERIREIIIAVGKLYGKTVTACLIIVFYIRAQSRIKSEMRIPVYIRRRNDGSVRTCKHRQNIGYELCFLTQRNVRDGSPRKTHFFIFIDLKFLHYRVRKNVRIRLCERIKFVKFFL